MIFISLVFLTTFQPVILPMYNDASKLAGNNIDRLKEEYTYMPGLKRNPVQPELRDGHTAEHIVKIFMEYIILKKITT